MISVTLCWAVAVSVTGVTMDPTEIFPTSNPPCPAAVSSLALWNGALALMVIFIPGLVVFWILAKSLAPLPWAFSRSPTETVPTTLPVPSGPLYSTI